MLLRLRLLCCSKQLIPQNLLTALCSDSPSADAALKLAIQELGEEAVDRLLQQLKEAQEDRCGICLENEGDCITHCAHCFHRSCIETFLKDESKPCPMCRKIICRSSLIEAPSEPIESESMTQADPATSAKLDRIFEIILSIIDTNRIEEGNDSRDRDDPFVPHKAVVFSQFTRFLDLIGQELQRRQIQFVRFDGTMTKNAREVVLKTFNNNSKVVILLASLKTASVGLNLTVADKLLLTDVWWNPAAEEQAIDRIYRMGQSRPVTVYRFIVEKTIEEKMLEIMHTNKQAVANLSLSVKAGFESKARWEFFEKILCL